MRASQLVDEVIKTLSLENSAVISIAEYENELNKYGLCLYNLESGLVLFHVVKRLLSESKDVILDFNGISYIPHAIIDECLIRLSCEYGKTLAKQVKIINLSENERNYIQSSIKYYMYTVFNTIYDDSNMYREAVLA